MREASGANSANRLTITTLPWLGRSLAGASDTFEGRAVGGVGVAETVAPGVCGAESACWPGLPGVAGFPLPVVPVGTLDPSRHTMAIPIASKNGNEAGDPGGG